MAKKKRPATSSSRTIPPSRGSHHYGRPRLNQNRLSFRHSTPPTPGGGFHALPTPTGPKPYHLDLSQIIPADQHQDILKANQLIFHVDGDLGGINYPVPQERVAQGLEDDFQPNPADKSVNPAFFYALGDCVYFNGQAADYYAQFYLPYQHYIAPIVAVPGNHDGWEIAPETSLEAFKRNFCQQHPGFHSPDAQDDPRTAMIQPNVFWTLTSPLVNIVGLYSNVPEHGVIHPDQQQWLVDELKSLPKNVPIIATMHHPPLSADDHHGGSQTMHDALDHAFSDSGRFADMVLAGHVHDYQRFTRAIKNPPIEIPYIVAGAGGYHNLHSVALVNGQKIVPPVTLTLSGDAVTLEKYLDDRHGFLRLEVSPTEIVGRYYSVPRPQESWSAGATLFDTFRLDLATHKVS